MADALSRARGHGGWIVRSPVDPARQSGARVPRGEVVCDREQAAGGAGPLDKARYRAGEQIQVRAQAGKMARTIVARLPGAIPASLRWSATEKGECRRIGGSARDSRRASIQCRVTAEDIAHNIGSGEVRVEIW